MNSAIGAFAIPTFYWKTSVILDHTLPLVTCIMPTSNRLDFLLRAIQYFLDQDYPYKELVILDDSDSSISKFIPTLYCIRYIYLAGKYSIGEKRNFACDKAAGSIITHLDDDDWYAKDWLSYQVNTLLKSNADICGLNRIQYYSQLTSHTYLITHNKKSVWLSGATLIYRKSFWKKHPFKDIQIDEDELFVKTPGIKLYAHSYYNGFRATIHSTNVKLKEF